MQPITVSKFVFLLFLSLFTISYTACDGCSTYGQVSSNSCTQDDYEYAEFWKYYNPIEAYNFGLEVQKIFDQKNKDKLLKIINSELANGPRRKFIAENDFDDIFPQNLINEIIQSSVPCSPNGWRGFTIGNGLIWYNLDEENNWSIFSINGAKSEKIYNDQPFWEIEGKTIHPICFNQPWISNDNFEELADIYSINEFEMFFNAPGLYYGKEITNFSKYIPSWCSNDDFCEKISIGHTISECPVISAYNQTEIHIWEFHTFDKKPIGIYQFFEQQYDKHEYYYSNLINLEPDVCRELAPDLKPLCSKVSLIEVGEYSGGSFGWNFSYGIYGLFNLPEIGGTILPLLFFSSKNDALNYVENLY